MRYAKIKNNDVANGPGIRVSLFVQGCHLHCPECFNQETWDFKGGIEKSWQDITKMLITALITNGIMRNLSILGGEPLCTENAQDVLHIIMAVKKALPDINIWLWTGYYLEDLYNLNNEIINNILNAIDVIVVGPFLIKDRDLTLKWRGSRNQTIYHLNKGEIISIEN